MPPKSPSKMLLSTCVSNSIEKIFKIYQSFFPGCMGIVRREEQKKHLNHQSVVLDMRLWNGILLPSALGELLILNISMATATYAGYAGAKRENNAVSGGKE